MLCVLEVFKKKRRSEEGFVFIVALIAVIVLVAIGFFALTMISEDVMISSRMVGERKAFSAAEAGAHAVFASMDMNSPYASISANPVQIDPVKDPSVSYSVEVNPGGLAMIQGYGSPASVYEAIITGQDSIYGSEVRLAIGLAPPPSNEMQPTKNEGG